MNTAPLYRRVRMAKLALPLVSLLSLAGACASAGGAGSGWETARQWDCDPAEVRAEYQEAYGDSSYAFEVVPRPGWSACQLLALNGPPTRAEQSDDGSTYFLYYETGGATRLVTLRRDVGVWRVAAVVR